MDENKDDLIPVELDETPDAQPDKPKSKIPLIALGVFVVGSLLWTGYSSMSTDEQVPMADTATAPPTILGTPSAEPSDGSGGDSKNRQPVVVPDPEVTFATEEPPPLPIEERKIPSDQNSIQAPTTPEWQPVVKDFGNAWGNFSAGQEKWQSNIRPYVTDRAYDMLKLTKVAGLEKRTVESVEEITFDGTGYAFNINFNEPDMKSLTGTVVMDAEDGFKWKVDIISEGS